MAADARACFWRHAGFVTISTAAAFVVGRTCAVRAATLGLVSLAMLAVAAAGLIAAFFVHEGRTPEPMLPLRLWRNRIIAGGNIANLAFGAVMMGVIAFLPVYIQGVMDRGALSVFTVWLGKLSGDGEIVTTGPVAVPFRVNMSGPPTERVYDNCAVRLPRAPCGWSTS